MRKSKLKIRSFLFLVMAICTMMFVSQSASLQVEAKASSYTINYNANKGKGKMTSQKCTTGKTVRLKANKFKRTGYTFLGWTTNKNGSGKVYKNQAKVKNLTQKESITLYAKWGKNYKVTFNPSGGKISKKTKTVVSTQKYGSLPKPTKKGYTFKGWYTKKSGGKKVTASTVVKLKKNQTLYAQWKENKYSITYHLDGGQNVATNPKSYKVTTKTITLAAPTRVGYTFAGWYTDSLCTKSITKIKKGSYGNLNLYAKWIPETYTITYHLDGGRNSYSNPSTYMVSTSRRLYNPSKTGYSFEGWYTDSNYTQGITSIAKGSTGNLNLYAKWSLETYSISYELNGGTNNPNNPTSYTYISGPHTLYPAEKHGYEFNTWRKNSNSGYSISTIEKNSYTGDLTLYADFDAIEYYIDYYLDGGTNHANNPTYYTVENADYALRNPSKEGYEFVGWYTDEEKTNPITKIDTDACVELTLYAAWEEIPVTRVEYIKDLNEALGFSADTVELPKDEDGNVQYSFDDLRSLSEEDALAVEIAVAQHIIDVPVATQEEPAYFYPEKAATRDFAAYAAVNALGFVGENPIASTDVEEVEHPIHAAIAVNQELLSLDENNAFNPDAFLQLDEESAILAKVAEIIALEPTSLESKEEITLAEGVSALSDITYNVSEETAEEISLLTVTDGDSDVEDVYTITVDSTSAIDGVELGDIIMLPASKEYPGGLAVKVLGIEETDTNGEVQIILTVKNPDNIAEVLTKVDISGYGTIANPEWITVEGAEGVTAVYDPNGTIDIPSQDSDDDLELVNKNIDEDGEISVPGTISFTFAEKELGPNTTLSGSIKVAIPSIAYRINMDIGWTGIDINDLYFAITEEIALEGEVTATVHDGGIADSGAIEIGRMPMPLGPTGFSVDLVFWFNYSAEGSASITYTLENTQGIQYINGDLRVIKESNSSLSAAAAGTFEAGPKLSLMLTYATIFDLVDITADVGGGVKAALDIRDTGLVCADLGTYVYLTVSAGQNSLIGELLGLEYEWEVWTNDNSPVRKNFHLEGQGLDISTWGKVPECTYGDGNLSGTVIMAESRERIPNAAVRIYKSNGTLYKTLYSDSNGSFSTTLTQGEYSVVVWARGFLSHSDNITIISGSNVYLDTALLIDDVNRDSQGTISGEILDSVTGNVVEGASLTVRRGYNNTTGEVVATAATDENGCYILTLNCGNYTLQFSKNGYIDTIINVAVKEQQTTNMNGEMTKNYTDDAEGVLRIVLTWGEEPSDLDSHIVGPRKDGSGLFHVYYSNRDYYYSGDSIVNLDRDDTTSYGPETTTVYSLNDTGTYSFYIHDYSNKYSSYSDEMSLSNATVKVYYSGALVRTFNVPYSQTGTLWHVFDFDAATKKITPKNIMSNQSSSSDVGLTQATSESTDVTDRSQMIMNDISNNLKDKQ